MNTKTLFISLAASLALLSSCVSNPGNNGSSSSASSAAPSESSAISSTDSSSSSSSESSYQPHESSQSSSSSESSSSQAEVSMGDWTLGPSALSDSAQSQYLNDYSFLITDTSGHEVSFYGDYIQRGKGEWDGTIQMKKEVGLLECRSKGSGTLSLSITKRIVSYGGEDRDFTGIPSLYISSDLENWSLLDGNKKDGDSSVSYSYNYTASYWKMVVGESNAVYLASASFEAAK